MEKGEGIDGDYIALVVWALRQSFSQPKELTRQKNLQNTAANRYIKKKNRQYFLDNVSVETLDTVLDRINTGSRTFICRAITQYNTGKMYKEGSDRQIT